LDYFQDVDEVLNGLKISDTFYYFTLWKTICDGLDKYQNDPNIRIKFEWMKKKYNEAVEAAPADAFCKQLPINI
jgi:predicted nucleotidyltransferase